MDSWKPIRYGTRFMEYEHERCFHGITFVETNMSLWDQQAFPWIRQLTVGRNITLILE
jgi:hypothetical protein